VAIGLGDAAALGCIGELAAAQVVIPKVGGEGKSFLRWFMTNWAVFDRTMVVYWSCLIGGEIATGRTRSVIDGTANPLWLHFLPNYGIYMPR
jgi:hypothetical protein